MKFGHIALAGALALGGLGVSSVVGPATQAEAATGYETAGFMETAVYNSGNNSWTYVKSGDTVDITGSADFQFGMDDGFTGYHTIKHYLNGVLIETTKAYKDENHMGEIVYLDVSRTGQHKIVLSPDAYPSQTSTFILNIK